MIRKEAERKKIKLVKMKAIGIDLGATKTIIALVNDKAKILKSIKFPTPKNKKELIEFLLLGIKAIKGKEKIKGIGIGVAAFLDEKKNIMKSPNMSFLDGLNLKKIIEKKIKVKCFIENDANAFGFAEAIKGKAKKFNSVLVITIGSGIGSALILNKKIYHGKSFALEAGHMSISLTKEKRKCNCGKINCIEAFASAKAIEKEAKKNFLKFNLKELCNSKNRKAIKIIENAAKYFGLFLANLFYLFDPEIIVLGGGLSNCNVFIRKAVKEMKKEIKIKRKPLIEKAFFNENSAAIGAALLVIKFL